MMSNDLYFIPLLFEALASVDMVEGLRRAVRTIIELGQDERFKKGYEQFLIFMDAVLAAHDHDANEGEVPATGGTDGTADLLGELAALPELAEIWDSVKRDLEEEPDTQICVAFQLRRNEEPPQSVQCSAEHRKGFFGGLLPGGYELSLSSGRVIWESELTKQDLLSAYAFAGEPLRLAADTEDVQEEPTRRIMLLDGEVVISVFAGPACGRMEIEWRDI